MGRNSTNNDNSAVGAEFASVVSPNGFSTGDLVYRSSSGYGVIPTGSVTSGSIQLSPSPIDSQTFATSGNIGTHPDLGGNGFATTAAKLSNGNIVVVYVRYGAIYFKVFDTNNNVVVAETQPFAFGVNNGYSLVAVVAFTGGFAIWSTNASNQLSNRAFTNAGVANYATVNTGINVPTYVSNQFLYLIPRPDNRYVVIYNDTTINGMVAVYNSTDGTAYSAATSITAGAVRVTASGAVVFSDNSFVVYTSSSGGGTNFNWYRRSATGAAVTSGTFTQSSQSGAQMVLLNNGNAAIYYKNTSNNLCYRSFTTSTNTVGSEVALITVNLSGSAPVNAYTIPGTNTNVVFLSSGSNVPWAIYDALTYMVVDGSTGTVSLGGTYPLTVLGMDSFVYTNYMHFVDLGTKLRAYMVTSGAILANAPGNTQGSIIYIEFDTSSFTPVNFASLSNSYSSASGVPAGAYSRSSSLPASAYFTASVNSNVLGSSPARGTVLLNQTVLAPHVATAGLRLFQLSTGNILAAWVVNTGAVFFKVFTPSFIEVAYVTVVTTGGAYGLAVSEFPDGKIAIAYANSSYTVDYKVFSSAFVEIQGATPLIGINIATQPWDMCALNTSTNRLVAVYKNGGTGTWVVRNQAGTQIDTNTFGIANVFSTNVNPIDNGGFVVNWAYGGGYIGINNYVPSAAFNAWYNLGTMNSSGITPPSTNSQFGTRTASVTPSGTNVYMATNTGGTIWVGITGTAIAAASTVNTSIGTANAWTNGNGWGGVATNSEGWFAGIYANVTSSSPSFMVSGQATNTGLSNTAAQFSTSTFLPSVYSNQSYMMACICPLYGSYFVVGQLNASGYPTIAAVSAYDRSYSAQAVSGTTPVGPVTIDPSTGFSLIGVAASDCAAGGAGQVQTKGTAVLSSSYPTTTQTFDFTNPVTYGVKGTVSNRVITLED